jgi:response regulator RpfG family c-di-GMP phosphodiesterase
LADTYAALTDARPFRAAWTEEEARREIEASAGIEFDPAVVSMFLSMEPLPEMASYARPGNDLLLVEPEPKQDRGWNLFSTFGK